MNINIMIFLYDWVSGGYFSSIVHNKLICFDHSTVKYDRKLIYVITFIPRVNGSMHTYMYIHSPWRDWSARVAATRGDSYRRRDAATGRGDTRGVSRRHAEISLFNLGVQSRGKDAAIFLPNYFMVSACGRKRKKSREPYCRKRSQELE